MMIEAAGLKARRNFTVLLLTTDNTNTYRIHTTKTTRRGVLRNSDRGTCLTGSENAGRIAVYGRCRVRVVQAAICDRQRQRHAQGLRSSHVLVCAGLPTPRTPSLDLPERHQY